MNNPKYFAILTIFSILIVENHSGLLDNVFGTVKDTTHQVTSGVGSLLSLGKDLVTGHHHSTGQEVTQEKKGIVRGFIDSVHQDIHNVHQAIRNVFVGDNKDGKGIIGTIYDRMKYKVGKVTGLFKADRETGTQIINNSHDNTLLAYQRLNALLFGNGTKNNSKLKKIINNLKNKNQSHRNSSENPKPDNENTDGTGLIDIRMASDNLARNLDEDMAQTRSRFNQGIDELNRNVARNRNYIESNAKNVLDKEKELMETGKQQIDEGAVVFRD